MIERLRELRKILGMNQAEFAEKLGSLSDIERGKVGLSSSNIALSCSLFTDNTTTRRFNYGRKPNKTVTQ